MKKLAVGIGSGLAVAGVLTLASVTPAWAETRTYPGVNCEGHAYTRAVTAATGDSHYIYNANGGTASNWWDNPWGEWQTHTMYTDVRRSTSARLETDHAFQTYQSSLHSCDN